MIRIAYFAPIAYHYLKQRPQHIAETLSKDFEIFYIEPTISSMKYVIKGGECFLSKSFDIAPNLHLIRVSGLFTAHRSLESIDPFGLNALSERFQLNKILKHCDVIWVGYPGWYNVIKNIKNRILIYDKMDDDVEIANNNMLKNFIKKAEAKLLKQANIILVTCQTFYDRIKPVNIETYLIRNALPSEFINQNINGFKILPRQFHFTYGYIGTISNWFDYKAINTILLQDERNKVIILGDNHLPKVDHDRIIYLPAVPKEELPSYINQFDVCLYPFIKSDWLHTINPVKIYEYLAFNKPVLAISSAETIVLKKYCYLYEDYNDLNEKCNATLKPPFQDEQEYYDFITKHTWEARVSDVKIILDRYMKKIELFR